MRWLVLLVLIVGCGDDDSTPTRDAAADTGDCVEGAVQCRGRDSFVCTGGSFVFNESCGDDRVCALDIGCRDCQPGRPFCMGNDVFICNADGMSSSFEMACEGTAMCQDGGCRDACADAATRGGENGCTFIGVGSESFMTFLNLVNRQEQEVNVVFSDGTSETLEPLRSIRVRSPTEPFRMQTDAPINVITEYGTDAALWLPTHLHEGRYRVLTWPGAEGSITVMSNIATEMRITPSADATINGSAVAAGATMAINVDQLEPISVTSDGDLTGTLVEADVALAVFVDPNGRVPLDASAPAHPDGAPGAWSNARMTEQLLPVELWGNTFWVVPASTRVDHPTYREPEVVRIVADGASNITTSLPAPDDSFSLEAGEFRDLIVQTDVVIESSAPVGVAQFLVSPEWLVTPLEGRSGSVAMGQVPAMEHQRRFFYFTALGTADRSIVARVPTDAPLRFDGVDLDGLEECSRGEGRMIGGESWQLVTCVDVPVGSHLIDSDSGDIVASVFGHDADRSYALPVGGEYR